MDKRTMAAQQSAVDQLMAKVEACGGFFETKPEYVGSKVIERFAAQVLAFHGTRKTLWDSAREAGLELLDPNLMSAETITRKLWDLVQWMGRVGYHLQTTDHLSDRELYRRLYHEVLRENPEVVDGLTASVTVIDMLDFSKEPDVLAYYRYYADEDMRDDWYDFFPDTPIPSMDKPPHDRDRFLPGAA